ncbi:MAG: YafY family transcriptional regulator [Treponema sp.]|nr:YafY family transcriptional regulator [Treponema sp.]
MKIDRLVSIIMLLLEKNRIGAEELAKMFEVSPRTIYRDIESISMAGIPVRSVPGVGGGIEILPSYKVDKKVFSSDDLSALLMGLSSLSGMIRSDELAGAMAKVKSIIPAEKAKEIELKASQIIIDLKPWYGQGNITPYLETVKTALQESRLVAFTYFDGHGNKSERTVEPYRLVLKGMNWYFYGFCLGRTDWRLFRLSRMTNLELKDERFSPREYKPPVLDFEKMPSEIQAEITLRVHKSIIDRILDFCPQDKIVPDDDEYFIVRFPFVESDWSYDMLLSLGEKFECLEPRSVREKLREKIFKMAERMREG